MFRKITVVGAIISLLVNPLGCAINDFRDTPPPLLDTLSQEPASAVHGTADARRPAADVGQPSGESNAVRPVNFLQLEREGEDETGVTMVVDLEFEDDPLEVVMITMLFDASKYKIIGSPDQTVTATIRALTMDDAMQQLQDQTDVLIVKTGDRFVVYSDGAEDKVAGPINYIYKCRRAKATDMVGIIDGVPPEGFPAAGELSTGEPIAPVQEVALGSEVMASNGLTEPLGAVEYQVVHHMNGIILRGELSEIRPAVDFLKTIDRPIPIVLIELLVVQYFHEDGFTWGYNLFDGQIARADAPISNGVVPGDGFTLDDFEDNTFGPRDFDPALPGAEGPGYGWNFERLAMSAATGALPLQFAAIGSLTGTFKQNVTLLCSEDLARVVTNPHVGVINGHQGTIMLNEKLNFYTSIVQPITGTVEEQQQEINNMTGLTVTPTIVGPDRIHMAINATVSALDGVVTREELPNQRINEIATSVVLGDNETLIIGGLVKEEMVEERSKVPGFASIPFLSYLFRNKRTTRRFTETVIYVTPHLDQPYGGEDAYLKQVFQQVDRLSERTETIRDKHRNDRRTSHGNYRWKEKLDHQQFKQTFKEEIHHHLEPLRRGHHGHYPGHQGYPYYEVMDSGQAQPTPGGAAPPGAAPEGDGGFPGFGATPGGGMGPDVAPEDDGGFSGFGPSPGGPMPPDAAPADDGGFPGFGPTDNGARRPIPAPAPVMESQERQLGDPFEDDPAPAPLPPVINAPGASRGNGTPPP